MLSILSDGSISYERKKPFANLLIELYLFTEKDSLVSVTVVANSKIFWSHVRKCGILINAIKDKIQESPNKDKIRIKFKALVAQFMSVPVS